MPAGAAFKRAWTMLGHERDTTDAADEERGRREVLTAATLQGAVFAGIEAAVDRAAPSPPAA